jgi:tetrahydromethanopterin S-methyltransferase subunit A
LRPSDELQTFYAEMIAAMLLAKCQKCGCMRETLDTLTSALPNIDVAAAVELAQRRNDWVALMQPIQYSCLGCDHCYAGAAQNAFVAAFPLAVTATPLSCDFQAGSNNNWPPIVGEYFVLDQAAPVAVSTLASVELAEQLAQRKPSGLAVVGKTETENIGLDKVIKNIVTNSAIRFLIVAGQEAAGHHSGQTLLALAANGVDAKSRVIGSAGKRPMLRNVSRAEIDAFRQQVQVIDLIGCDNLDEIADRIAMLAQSAAPTCSCGSCGDTPAPVAISTVTTLTATESADTVIMDKAGYFVVVPLSDRRVINVEHYAYDDTLLNVIEGSSARALYQTIIANEWISELSHAAYLGKELAKAELALQHGFKYVQDGA